MEENRSGDVDRRTVLQTVGGAAGTMAMVGPVQASTKKEDRINTKKSTNKFIDVNFGVTDTPDDVLLASGSRRRAPARTVGETVYITSYRRENIDLNDTKPVVRFPTGLTQVSNESVIQFDSVPIFSDSIGGRTYLANSERELEMSISMTNREATIEFNGREYVAKRGENIIDSYETSLTVGQNTYETEMKVSIEYNGEVDLIGHETKTIVPMNSRIGRTAHELFQKNGVRAVSGRSKRVSVSPLNDVKAFVIEEETKSHSPYDVQNGGEN